MKLLIMYLSSVYLHTHPLQNALYDKLAQDRFNKSYESWYESSIFMKKDKFLDG
jgi:hypothetical protein